MKIYTKTGDKGETSLFGAGRVSKDNIRIEAYGTVDELNSFIGLAITETKNQEITQTLIKIQNQLFILGSDLASPNEIESKNISIPRITVEDYKYIEQQIDFFSEKLDELKYFILPGGTKSSAILHIARTICRRAERRVVALNNTVKINSNIIIFLNRISDLLFVLARYENKISGVDDIKWEK
ncbi:MAG: cob(I)yrinic acid a,c-diamide adenosyltransferase [Ignavibacterium sp.]